MRLTLKPRELHYVKLTESQRAAVQRTFESYVEVYPGLRRQLEQGWAYLILELIAKTTDPLCFWVVSRTSENPYYVNLRAHGVGSCTCRYVRFGKAPSIVSEQGIERKFCGHVAAATLLVEARSGSIETTGLRVVK